MQRNCQEHANRCKLSGPALIINEEVRYESSELEMQSASGAESASEQPSNREEIIGAALVCLTRFKM
jgi:hypothetical protein